MSPTNGSKPFAGSARFVIRAQTVKGELTFGVDYDRQLIIDLAEELKRCAMVLGEGHSIVVDMSRAGIAVNVLRRIPTFTSNEEMQ